MHQQTLQMIYQNKSVQKVLIYWQGGAPMPGQAPGYGAPSAAYGAPPAAYGAPPAGYGGAQPPQVAMPGGAPQQVYQVGNMCPMMYM